MAYKKNDLEHSNLLRDLSGLSNKPASFDSILEGINTVALGGHVRPDGDCVGSSMGLFLYIKKKFPEVEVDVYLEPIPEVFHLLTGTEHIQNNVKEVKSYDLFITLDCADEERLGFSLPLYHEAKKTLCIDHHVSNTGYADINYIAAKASSTSELVYTLLEETFIDKNIAECLYTGIVHDTGVFRFSSTSPETMEIVAALLRKGVKNDEIVEKTYFERTFIQTRITGKALMDSELILDGRCIVSALNKKDMEEFGANTYDLDGIVNQLWLTKDVDVAIFLYELETGEYKVSLRSSDKIDVSKIASVFGGGGHKKAAGFNTKEPSEHAIDLICQELMKV